MKKYYHSELLLCGAMLIYAVIIWLLGATGAIGLLPALGLGLCLLIIFGIVVYVCKRRALSEGVWVGYTSGNRRARIMTQAACPLVALVWKHIRAEWATWYLGLFIATAVATVPILIITIIDLQKTDDQHFQA